MTNDAKAILIVLLLIAFMLALILSGCAPVIKDRCEYQIIPKYEENDLPRIVEENEVPQDEPTPEPEPQAEPVKGRFICQL
jgi:hypothetical protein